MKARSRGWGRLASTAARAASGLLAVALLASGGFAQAAARPRGIAGQHRQRAPAAASRQRAAPGVISTVAGGVGGPGRATAVDVSFPCGVSFGAGALYIAAVQTVRRVQPATGWLTTPAGTDAISPVGDGGPATRANVETCGAAADHDGNLLIANFEDQRLQVVAARSGTFYGQAMTAGHIYTVAGDGARGTAGDGGPAIKAGLHYPEDVAVDHAGNLVITDTRNRRVQVVAATSGTFYGQAMTAGHIYTVAGDGAQGYFGDGGPGASAWVGLPCGVAVDAAGNVLIADSDTGRIREVAG